MKEFSRRKLLTGVGVGTAVIVIENIPIFTIQAQAPGLKPIPSSPRPDQNEPSVRFPNANPESAQRWIAEENIAEIARKQKAKVESLEEDKDDAKEFKRQIPGVPIPLAQGEKGKLVFSPVMGANFLAIMSPEQNRVFDFQSRFQGVTVRSTKIPLSASGIDVVLDGHQVEFLFPKGSKINVGTDNQKVNLGQTLAKVRFVKGDLIDLVLNQLARNPEVDAKSVVTIVRSYDLRLNKWEDVELMDEMLPLTPARPVFA